MRGLVVLFALAILVGTGVTPTPAVVSGSEVPAEFPSASLEALESSEASEGSAFFAVVVGAELLKITGSTFQVSLNVTPMWANLTEVQLVAMASSGATVDVPATIPPIVQYASGMVNATINIGSAETQKVEFEVVGNSSLGTLTGYRRVFFQTVDGTTTAHVDHLPVSPYAEPAIQIREKSTPSGGRFASTPTGETPDAVPGLLLQPMPPGAEQPGEGGDAPAGNESGPQEAQGDMNESATGNESDSAQSANGTGDDGGFTTMSATHFQVFVCWEFIDHEGDFRSQRWAQIEVYNGALLASGLTGADGCYLSSSIPRSGNPSIQVKFIACNTIVCAKSAGGTVYNGFSGVHSVTSDDILDIGTYLVGTNNDWAWREFTFLNNAWDFSINHMGYSGLPRVDLLIPAACASGADACYQSNIIRSQANGIVDNEPDVMGHEYAHFVMDTVYGLALTGGPHGLCDDNQNRSLAWSEGFASFFGVLQDFVMFPQPGTTGDTLWANSNRNLESNTCSGAQGDDSEWNVAATLWDLRDVPVDGLDQYSNSDSQIHSVVRACDDSSLNDYYNGAGASPNSPSCNWSNNGGNLCNFVTAAAQNRITDLSFNALPTTTITSPNSFYWYHDNGLYASGTGSDAECNPTLEFRLSSDATCTASDPLIGTVVGTSGTFPSVNTALVSDSSNARVCLRANDQVTFGNFAMSTNFGIDNTDPIAIAMYTCSIPGTNNWCRTSGSIDFVYSDAMSGLLYANCTHNGSPIACSLTFYSSQGPHLGKISAGDYATNFASSQALLKIDSVAPAAGISVPNPALLTFAATWTATDSTSGLSYVEVQERFATLSGTYTTVCSTSTFGANYWGADCERGINAGGPLIPGQYCYRSRAVDMAGNVGYSPEACVIYV